MVRKPTEFTDPVDGFEEPIEGLEEAVEEQDELLDGLTPEERAEIEAEAVALVAKETKAKARADYKAKAVAEARRVANIDPNEKVMVVHIDLPGHADCITINGVKFWHGGTYKVQQSLGAFLLEKQQACWRHEDEIGGSNREIRKQRNLKISSKDVGAPNSYLLNRG